MLRRVVLAASLCLPRAAGAASAPAAKDYEALIAEANDQQSQGNPIEASDTYRRAFEAMSADLKREDIGEDVAATLHFDACQTAWRLDGDIGHLEQAKRVLEVLIAEQRAAVTAGSRASVSEDAEQKLALVRENIERLTAPTPDPKPIDDPGPIILTRPPPPPAPDLGTPIALLAVGSTLGLGGLACIIGGEGSRAVNTNTYESASPEMQALNDKYLDNINRTSTAVTITGAIAMVGGIAMVVPGAIFYRRRTSEPEARLLPVGTPLFVGASLRLRF